MDIVASLYPSAIQATIRCARFMSERLFGGWAHLAVSQLLVLSDASIGYPGRKMLFPVDR